jgi:hypothetical protein
MFPILATFCIIKDKQTSETHRGFAWFGFSQMRSRFVRLPALLSIFVAFGVFCFLPKAHAAISMVASTTAVCTSSYSSCSASSSPINTTGATLLVLVDSEFSHNPASSTVSDSMGNTWHHLTVVNDSSGSAVEMVIWYAYDHSGSALAVGSGQTFNVSGAAYPAVAISAYSGTQTGSNPFDQQNGNKLATASTTIQSASITPSVNGELIVAAEGANNPGENTQSINSGFTIINALNAVSSQNVNNWAAYYVQSSAASVGPTWTGLSTISRLAVIASFFSAGTSLPTISSFSASPSVVALNGTSTLSWVTSNATSLSISPTIGTVTGSSTTTPALSTTTLYTLTAVNSNGTTTATTTVSVATAPTAPGSFSVTGTTASTTSLSWASSTPNNGATISFYTIYRGTATSSMPQIATTSAITYTNTGLATSTTYYYYVTAQDSVGNISASSTIASGTTLSGYLLAATIAQCGTVSCTATSTSVTTTGATLLVMNVSAPTCTNPSAFTVSDSLGNAWHHLTLNNDCGSSGDEQVIWYAYDHGGSALSRPVLIPLRFSAVMFRPTYPFSKVRSRARIRMISKVVGMPQIL